MRLWGAIVILSALLMSWVSNSRAFESPAPASAALPAMSWSCDELNTRWKTYHDELKVRWAYATFTCPSAMSSIAEAMALLHDLVPQADSAGHVTNYYSWLAQTERGIDYANEETAGAMAHYHGTSVITIMNPFFKAPLMQRAAMLVHEGRHATWPADPGHVDCGHGDQKGLASGCDADFHPQDGGGSGYNWGWVFMWHLMEDPNAVPAEHDKILALLKWELNNRFNEVKPEDKAFFMKRWNWDGK